MYITLFSVIKTRVSEESFHILGQGDSVLWRCQLFQNESSDLMQFHSKSQKEKNIQEVLENNYFCAYQSD